MTDSLNPETAATPAGETVTPDPATAGTVTPEAESVVTTAPEQATIEAGTETKETAAPAATAETPQTSGGSDAAETVPVKPAGPQVVYVGPRLRKPFPVAPKTIFRGDLPKPLAKAVKADADLAALFVPAAEYGAALLALRRSGSTLSRSAAAVTSHYVAASKE